MADECRRRFTVYNVEEPKIPLLLARSRNLFKLFQSDVSWYGGGVLRKKDISCFVLMACCSAYGKASAGVASAGRGVETGAEFRRARACLRLPRFCLSPMDLDRSFSLQKCGSLKGPSPGRAWQLGRVSGPGCLILSCCRSRCVRPVSG